MGLFSKPSEHEAAGRAQARADKKAGGFGAAHDGSDPEMTEQEAEDFNRGYQKVAPKAWYRQR